MDAARKFDWREAYRKFRAAVKMAETKARDYFSARGADIYTRFIRRMFLFLIIAGLLAAAVSVAVLLVASLAKPLAKVPSVKGMNVVDASIAVQEKGLAVEVDGKFDAGIEKFTVIEQFPRSGITVRKGRTVTLLVSMGRDVYTVPNVTGISRAEAEKILSEKNIGYELTVIQNADYAVDTVISQDLAEGREVERAVKMKLLVNSDVARGEFRVQDYTRQGADLVVKTLLAASIQPVLEKIPTRNSDEDGMILSQNTAAGTVIPRNSDLKLQVGVYGEDDLERSKFNYFIFSYMLGSMGGTVTNETADPAAGQPVVRVLMTDERGQQQEILAKIAVPNEFIVVTFKAYGKARVSLVINNNFVKETEYDAP